MSLFFVLVDVRGSSVDADVLNMEPRSIGWWSLWSLVYWFYGVTLALFRPVHIARALPRKWRLTALIAYLLPLLLVSGTAVL
jgi:hypothetical protein